jgi:V8-like Glu-specific endopeptidase
VQRHLLGICLSAAAAAGAAVPAVAQGGPVPAGQVQPYGGGTATLPSSSGAGAILWSETIRVEGALFLRAHFSSFNLAFGDTLIVSRPDGTQASQYSGRGPAGGWSLSVDGDAMRLRVRAGSAGSRSGYGFRVDSVVRGDVSLSVESICGDNGYENIACHPEANAAQRPVARLNFVVNGSGFLCTGWLVRGASASTMLTNQHCFADQTATNTVEARFNYQTAACAGGAMAGETRYLGGTWRRSSAALDYTIYTVNGNPEATWGELIPSNQPPAVGQLIWVIQHPGGQPKKIGHWEDAAHTQRCDVEAINVNLGNGANQVGYSCDTEGGSSGSPVVRAGTTTAIGLHHFGGCRNHATQMSAVCADAGALLQCGTAATPTATARPRATATATARTRATPTARPRATATARPRATPTSGGAAAWQPNVFYAVGNLATYGGATYRCIQAHTSQTGWEPPNVPALWARQ